MVGNLSFLYRSPIMLAIDEALEAQAKLEPSRTYLGMSAIGHPCERKIWYGLRFKREIEARGIRCIQDGHAGELLMAERLRMVGLRITGQQRFFSDFDDRFGGHPDGIIEGITSKPHIWEHKQVNEKKFKEFQKLKEQDPYTALEKWDETYYAQAQLYMRYSGLERHYLTVATPGGRDYDDTRTRYSDRKAEALRDKARRILDADSEPGRINDNPSFYICKMCEHRERCHG